MNDIFELINREIDFGDYQLRILQEQDFDVIYEIYSNPECMRYQGIGLMKDISMATSFVSHAIKAMESRYFVKWCIVRKETGKVVGVLSVHQIDHHNFNCQIGYMLKYSEWNKGIMSHILSEMAHILLNEFDFKRIELTIHPENLASIRVAEKSGFIKEGCKKSCVFNPQSKIFEDRVIMGKIRSNDEVLL